MILPANPASGKMNGIYAMGKKVWKGYLFSDKIIFTTAMGNILLPNLLLDR
jgi:hypothetical protein